MNFKFYLKRALCRLLRRHIQEVVRTHDGPIITYWDVCKSCKTRVALMRLS